LAKLVNPLHSSAARGKVGGTVYNQSRGINYAKVNTAPAQPRTADQLAVRSLMTTIIREFRELTAVQQAAWATYADEHPRNDWTGQPIRLTAANAYAAVNFLARDAGGVQITAPPSAAAPSLPAALAVAINVADIEATFTGPLPAATKLDIRYLGPVSKGVQGRFERSTRLAYSAAAQVSPFELVATAPTGRHIFWIRSVNTTSGLASMWQKFTVDV
jgi:hypothetical protein